MWGFRVPSFRGSEDLESGTLRMICKPQKLGPFIVWLFGWHYHLSSRANALLFIHSLNMLICHILTIHELQKQLEWQLSPAFLSGSRKHMPNSYCPLPLPGHLLRKHPNTDDNRITVAGHADYLLQSPTVLSWGKISDPICHRTCSH